MTTTTMSRNTFAISLPMARLAAWAMVAPALMLASCDFIGGSSEEVRVNSAMHPVEIDGQWGFVSSEGRIAVVPAYDGADDFSEGRAAVQVGLDWGYIDEGGNVAVAPQYRIAGRFSEGLAAVRGSDLAAQYGFIDIFGNEVIPAQFDVAKPFSEGYAAVRVSGQWGFVSTNGTMVVPPTVRGRAILL